MSKLRNLFFVFWVVVIIFGMQMDRWHEREFLPPAEERERTDILIDVVGEARVVLARYLWFQMDITYELASESADKDKAGDEVMPLLRMITVLDPTVTEAYDQIVWDLYVGHGDKETALSILEEGIKANPYSYELVFRRALLAYMEEDFEVSREYAALGLTLTNDEVQMADCLRLIYWSSDKQNLSDLRDRALQDLLHLRPNDPLWTDEKKRIEALTEGH